MVRKTLNWVDKQVETACHEEGKIKPYARAFRAGAVEGVVNLMVFCEVATITFGLTNLIVKTIKK